ncbi:MAG: hypothetical protein D6706_00475 [Chloroflexi bacterium]|nr:MAG: hypothetical protein D6706_00475 [Chloroflexota bacterium]
MSRKTLLVGLDAACWSFLEPLLEQGKLPTIASLLHDGIWGTLDSTMPALTPAAWSSIATGKNPGKHGIFDMTRRRSGSYEQIPVNARLRYGTPFWKRLNEAGVRVGLVNIPFTYPPDEVDGFVVPGFGAPGNTSDLTWPPDALTWIEQKFGPYEPAVSASVLRSGQYDLIYETERNHQARQVEIALALAERYQVDVLAINLMLLDHINHKMPDMARVEQAICHLDEDLARLIMGFDPDYVMAISDHGSRRVKGDFLLHAWLRDQGYAVQLERPLSARADVTNWILTHWFQAKAGNDHLPLSYKVWRRLLKTGLTYLPTKLSDTLWQKIEQDIPFAREYMRFAPELDFTQTVAYPGASYSGLIYLNLAGREPGGIVPPERRAELAAELAEKLMTITDPDTGAPLFRAVYTSDELYAGSAGLAAPDLIIDMYNSDWNILSTFRRGAYAEQARARYFVDSIKDFGHHSRDGIFIYSGPDFATGQVEEIGHVMDIPATLLHLYDVPVPEDWDGRSRPELFTPEFLATHPLRTQPGDPETAVSTEDIYTTDETEAIVSHLRALGYVD